MTVDIDLAIIEAERRAQAALAEAKEQQQLAEALRVARKNGWKLQHETAEAEERSRRTD